MKASVFHNNEHTNIVISKLDITPEECRKTSTHSHYLSSRKHNKVTNTTPYNIHSSKQTLPRHMCAKLAQLRANKSPLLQSYLKAENPKTYMPQCPLCLSQHMTLITSLTVVKYQHNTTPLVGGKSL